MTTFQIKLIAITTMIIDHVGLFFFPNILIFRIIGRLAFPLFAWLIAVGASYTTSIKKYLVRLVVFALVSQFPYVYARRMIEPEFWDMNVLFTLAVGLLVIFAIRKSQNNLLRIGVVTMASILAQVFRFDFGAIGVLSIVGFYIFRDKPNKLVIYQVATYISQLPVVFFYYPGFDLWEIINKLHYITPFSLLSLFIIFLFNKKRGYGAKYIFYIVYPLQFVVVILTKLFLT